MNHADLQKAHRHFAVEAFNTCWQLIDQTERSDQEQRTMIRLAESSYWHWMLVEDHTAENQSVGLWLLARVYTLAGDAETAVNYALTCLETAREHQLGPFHIGYALEASARAYQAQSKETQYREALEEAWTIAGRINDTDSRELLEADLRDLSPCD